MGNDFGIQRPPISKITLGTAQLGIPYGLKDNAKVPTLDEAQRVLSCAYEHGIKSIDTALAYGDSEEKIGVWLHGHHEVVTTKIHDLDTSSESALLSSMKEQALLSKKRLQIHCIPILMIHHFDEYIAHKEAFNYAFAKLKEEGHILYSGVSVYSTDDYFQIAESGLDAVQIPINILDWTQIDSGGLKALSDAGMIVFARSIYLQGLLLRTPETLQPRMAYASEILEKFIKLSNNYGMSQKELAMSFVLSLPEVSSLVIGCRNEKQVIGNCEIYRHCRKITEEQMEEIHKLFGKTDKSILIPMFWPKV